MFVKMSLSNRLVCFGSCWKDSARRLHLATTSQLFSQSLHSHTLSRCLKSFSTSKNFCNFCRTKF